ncbi:S41 family peptidase [Azospirillum canadense]|uniref:S41 family peptidase n=1 Tax=Azospirillum canadense TaxID=403962 RepID=UPI0022262D91|nr:S41 family peptidase [Azospirillum canadense]MCW2241536.1 carboxyl-terminal processing protease [Azospirillum canadense]
MRFNAETDVVVANMRVFRDVPRNSGTRLPGHWGSRIGDTEQSGPLAMIEHRRDASALHTVRPASPRHSGCRALRLALPLLALALALATETACVVRSADHDPIDAALERYRAAFAAMRPSALPPSTSDPNYILFADVLQHVLSSHVKSADPERLIDTAVAGLGKKRQDDRTASERVLTESAIGAMLASLDPYSGFLDAEHVQDVRDQMHGEFPGLGMVVAPDDGSGLLRVVSANANTPAARAGVRSGDLIARIDDREVKGLSLHEAVMTMRGPSGGGVTLLLLRPGNDVPLLVSVTRTMVRSEPVLHRVESGVAYIRITHFTEQTSRLVHEAFDTMRHQTDRELAGVVLDLRDNPGGLFDQGVRVADAFLGAVEIVSTRSRVSGVQHYSGGTGDDVVRDLPLAVLIDSGTTSAAEVVAGALQDHHRALLFGGRSYGKGSVQTIFQLAGGDGLRLTTARYFRPSGGPVECFGIVPNVAITPAGRPPPPGAWPRTTAAEEMHPDPATCDPDAVAPTPPRTWAMTELCPEVASTPPMSELDRSLDCALAALRTRRLDRALTP